MFYEHPLLTRQIPSQSQIESAIVVLNPAESKRLIARAVAALPEVKAALEKGIWIIGWGTTNAFVAEEITGKSIGHKTDFASGVICDGELKANDSSTRMMPLVLRHGKTSDMHQKAALNEFKPGDVFIKGANAIDINGNVGILVAAQQGGSVHDAWLGTAVRGGHFICPVGLEKLVPSVSEAASKCSMFRFKCSTGLPVSLVTLATAQAVTEIQAIRVLTGVSATHVASGGSGGSEGAVTLVLEGEAQTLDKAFQLIKSIKGEPPVPSPRQTRVPPAASMNYDAKAIGELFQKS